MIATADDPERPETPTVTGYSGTGRVFTGPLGSDPREWVEIGTVAAGGITLEDAQAEPDRPIPLAGQTLTLDIDLDEVDEGLLELLAGKTRDRWWHRYTRLRYCTPCDKAYRPWPWLTRRHRRCQCGSQWFAALPQGVQDDVGQALDALKARRQDEERNGQ